MLMSPEPLRYPDMSDPELACRPYVGGGGGGGGEGGARPPSTTADGCRTMASTTRPGHHQYHRRKRPATALALRPDLPPPHTHPQPNPTPTLHPRYVDGSGKLHLLDRMLRRLKEENHRVLIFSQMTTMLDVIEDYITTRQWGYQRIDGNTAARLRQARIDSFNRCVCVVRVCVCARARVWMVVWPWEQRYSAPWPTLLPFLLSIPPAPAPPSPQGQDRRRAVHFPPLYARGRPGHQPRHRRHRHHLRRRLEPTQRPAGPGARTPHRPEEQRSAGIRGVARWPTESQVHSLRRGHRPAPERSL